jgi:hypothetical protein
VKERIERGGQFLGWLEPYQAPQAGRYGVGKVRRPVFWCYLPNGERTQFTLPSRKQAIEWLQQAAQVVR